MKKTFPLLFAVVAATALCALSAVAQSGQPEMNQSLRSPGVISVTYRDPNIIRAELKQWVPPVPKYLEARATDAGPLFVITAGTRSHDVHVAGITRLGYGGGSGGITRDANRGSSKWVDKMKAGRFVEGGSYLVGAQSETTPWGKNLTS